MWKIALFVLLCFQTVQPDLVCSINRHEKNSCVCVTKTDGLDNFPVMAANCKNKNLNQFPADFILTRSVNYIDLSFNGITALEYRYKSINKTDELRTLILRYNQIDVIDDEFFSDYPNLQRLDLSHNKIKAMDNSDVFFDNKYIHKLDLSFNYLTSLPDKMFESLTNLKYLDLSYNALGEFLDTPNVLKDKLGLATTIMTLKLSSVGLQQPPAGYFHDYIHLITVHLADNNLTNIPRLTQAVENLDMSGNPIERLSMDYLDYISLENLKLNRLDKLKTIEKYAFSKLEALEDLSISDCHKLKHLNGSIFGKTFKNVIFSLRRLSLARNSLETLSVFYKDLFDRLEFIDISDNPWICSCDLLWLQEFKDKLYRNDSIRCFRPINLARNLLTEITPNQVPQCYPEIYGKMSHKILLVILSVLVICLMGMILYLLCYAPGWQNVLRRTKLGPNSPYNTDSLTVQDEA